MTKRLARVMVLGAAILVAASLVGCNLAPPPAEVKRESPKAVPLEKTKATVRPPADWPKELPLYPGAELENATPTAPGSTMLTLKTKDSASEIFNWYYDELEARKWTILGPTLDVGQNVAIIKATLGAKVMYLEARTSQSENGATALLLTTGPLQPERRY